jgi:hypothetical protein
MLTAEQRAELESLGPATVRTKLLQSGAGRGASVAGFKCGDITRAEIDDWLVEKHVEETDVQNSTLRWAKIAAWAGIAGVLVGVSAIVVTIWLAK